MTAGIRRSPYQILPESEARINCVEINDHSFAEHEWFLQSLKSWSYLTDDLKVYLENGSWDTWVSKDWDFVLVVPWNSVRRYWCSNDGMQAWRHKQTGYVVPDYCRQTGGCPEVWHVDDVRGKRELKIANLAEVGPFVVLDLNRISAQVFPEHAFLRANQTS